MRGEEIDLVHAVKTPGNKGFVFSSDFPHEVNAKSCQHEIDELTANVSWSTADKDAILCGNARRLYAM